ncbi:hypothetical protein BCR42DRAFT_415730 [Absidia repens]|uniref:FYVE-type domain-containing protein n=1 Tax=Absidia repens TaxID=90262 RepID=A0A1X2IFN2_9FUNG|nr:hypothetical protein BCR42DRAFT_415730 [Absidia repens]
MDIYALTQKRRPSRLTMAKTSSARSFSSTTTESNHSGHYIITSTGPPTKEHWKLDKDAAGCTHPGCSNLFSVFKRRHHCRKCGNIFCYRHCSNYLRLNQDSEFHPRGFLSRGCDQCADKWRYSSLTTGSAFSADSSDDNSVEEQQPKGKENPNRHAGIMTTFQPHALEGVLELGRDDIVQHVEIKSNGMDIGSKKVEGTFNTVSLSVPVDWHWSTF